jgi:APA family basic amino acid/polyamine antiporter
MEYEKHSTGLVRRLGTFSAVMVVVAAMIGSGVFKKVAPMSQELGSSGWVLAAWVLAGMVTLAGALTNAEIAGIIAEPGGQYKYFEKMYGRFFAYIYGWTNFSVIQSATAASVGYVFAQSINSLITSPRFSADIEAISVAGIFFPFENFGVKALTILLIIGLTAINYRGVHYGSMVSNVLSSAVLVAIALITVLCFGFGGTGGFSFETSGTPIESEGLLTPLFTALMAAFWAYEGWNSLGFLGGEVKEPQRTIPRALMFGVGMVMAVYVAINAAYLYVLPISDLIPYPNSANEIAAVKVVSIFLGPAGQAFILILIITATFSSTNNTLMAASRVYFAMAHDGLFFKAAKKCNASGVPSIALLIQGFWASMLVLSGSFDQLTDMLVFAAFIFYGAGAAGLFVLRAKMPNARRDFRVPLYPVLPALFVLFCAVLVYISIQERPREAGVGLALIASGLPFYFYFSRNRKGEMMAKEHSAS